MPLQRLSNTRNNLCVYICNLTNTLAQGLYYLVPSVPVEVGDRVMLNTVLPTLSTPVESLQSLQDPHDVHDGCFTVLEIHNKTFYHQKM